MSLLVKQELKIIHFFSRVCCSWNELPPNILGSLTPCQSFARKYLLIFIISSVLIFELGYLIFIMSELVFDIDFLN